MMSESRTVNMKHQWPGGVLPPDTRLFRCLTTVMTLLVLFAGPAYGQSSKTELSISPADSSNSEISELQPAEAYPELVEYLKVAAEENPELGSLYHLYLAELEKSREAGVLPDPELSINYDFNPMMSESQLGRFSVSAMQMFPWFGTLGTRQEAQQHVAEANRTQIDSRQLEILRDVQIAWLDIAEIHQQIRIAEENLELVHDLESLVEIRYETGRTGQADILRIQMEAERIQNRIEDLRDQLNPVTARFNELLNRDADSEVQTTDSVQKAELPYAPEEIYNLAMEQNPVFETLTARESVLQSREKLATLNGRPSIGVGVEVMGRDFGPMSMFPDATESYIGMATIRIPIYRSRTNSQKKQISEQLNALKLQRYQAESRISTNLESALESVRSSNRSLELIDQELIPRARQALDILSEEYTAGNARFDELLQIQRELLDLEIERIKTLTRQNRGVVKVKALLGEPVLGKGLKPGEPDGG